MGSVPIEGLGDARLWIEPHRQAGARHVLLGLPHRVFPEMEDRGGEHGSGVSVADALDQVIKRAHAARSDPRHRTGICADCAADQLVSERAVPARQGDQIAAAISGHQPGGPANGAR